MSSVQASIHAQADAFKSALEQANQHILEVEHLLDTLDKEFETFDSHLKSETEKHLHRLHALTDDCHALERELTEAFHHVGEVIGTTEDTSQPLVAEVVKTVEHLDEENDQLSHSLEESDQSLGHLIEEIGQAANDTAHKVEEATSHVMDTGRQTAEKFGHELVSHVHDLNEKINQHLHEFEAHANDQLHHLEQEVSTYGHHLTEQAHHFAEQAESAGNSAKEKLLASVHDLEQGVMGQLGNLGQNVQHFHDDFNKLSEFISHLGQDGVDTVQTLGEAIDMVNVGLNGVAKTVSNVKEILDEIHL